ncbi:MAG TPA: GNAT family N-acetyltransferase, partial [Actinomycetes bacterium]|nr:GNAT family N-acetyltransferase [Actinomycetes bacterium]
MDAPSPLVWPRPVPELLTPRLRLRALSPEDAAGVLQVLGDDQVTRYHSMPTLTTLEEAHAALAQLERRYEAGELLRWAIEIAGRPG